MTHLKAGSTRAMSVTTGDIRWGSPLKCISSTVLGSIISSFNRAWELLNKRQVMMELIQTLLPEPVAPAISRWGIVSRLAATGWPETSCPSATFKGESKSWNSFVSMTARSATREILSLGTSMPTMERPGTGASMRIGAAARASARSLERALILLTRTFLETI
jgi:hypothetical protein